MRGLVLTATLLGSLMAGVVASGATLDGIVPGDAVAFVEVGDTRELLADFDASALGRAVRASRLLSYLRTVLGAGYGFLGTVVTGLPAQELDRALGNHLALALLDFKDPADLRARVPVVLLLEATEPAKLHDALVAQLQLLSLLGTDLEASEKKHGDLTVHELAGPRGPRLAFATVGNVLVAGTSGGVGALLSSAGKPALADNPLYARIRKRLGGDGLFAFLNVRALKDKSGVAANPLQLRALGALGLGASEAAALSIAFEGGRVRERLFVHTGTQPTGLVRMLTAGRPVEPTMLRFIPGTYTAVLAFSLRDVGLWDRFRTMLVQAAGPGAGDFLQTIVTRVEQQHGINIKSDVLDAFGDEVAVGIDLSRLESFFGAPREPTPEEVPVVFAARLAKPQVLSATLDKLAASQALWQQGVERKARKVGDQTLYSFSVPLNPDVRPSYVLSGDTLLASLRPEPLQAALAAPQKPFALKAAGPNQPVHAMVQFDDSAFLASVLRCIRGELPAGTARLLADLEPVIASLRGYQATLRREQGGVLIEARSDLGTLGTFALAAILFDQGNRVVARRVEGDFDRLAKALERYREQKGHYPETLDQLVPDFLPELPRDRFAPRRAYGYSRGQPGPEGKLPDAWLLTSVGPDKRPNIPVEQFDPPQWSRKLASNDPEDIQLLKRAIYRFQPDRYRDERKNDDEGDLYRMGGRGLKQTPPQQPRPEPRTPAREAADDNF